MTSMLKKLGTCSVLAIAMVGAAPAFAAGTTSGSSVLNTATVDYQVGGVAQPQLSANNTFTVDTKVNLTVAEVGTTTTTVAPGSTAQVTTFTVTNTSNTVMDFGLGVSQSAGGTSAHGGTDTFDVTGATIYRDTNNNGVYDAGTDTAVTYLDELAADASATVFVVANIPGGLATGAVAEVNLTATSQAGGTAGTAGAVLTQTAGANTTGVDVVFADAAGTATGDVARDGKHSDDDDYTVSTAALTVAKYSRVISDPLNGTTNPKMIPGAVVEYCIAVTNAAGGSAATNVAINDPLPTQVTGQAGTGKLGGTGTSTTCDYTGTAGGTITATNASGTIATVAAGSTSTFVFQVVIK